MGRGLSWRAIQAARPAGGDQVCLPRRRRRRWDEECAHAAASGSEREAQRELADLLFGPTPSSWYDFGLMSDTGSFYLIVLGTPAR
jgi:hypothetical protein